MAFVIQDIDNNKYLKHSGYHKEDHPYIDVNTQEEAEQYISFEHVTYVVFWYCSVFRNYRVINTETGKTWVKDTGSKFKLEAR